MIRSYEKGHVRRKNYERDSLSKGRLILLDDKTDEHWIMDILRGRMRIPSLIISISFFSLCMKCLPMTFARAAYCTSSLAIGRLGRHPLGDCSARLCIRPMLNSFRGENSEFENRYDDLRQLLSEDGGETGEGLLGAALGRAARALSSESGEVEDVLHAATVRASSTLEKERANLGGSEDTAEKSEDEFKSNYDEIADMALGGGYVVGSSGRGTKSQRTSASNNFAEGMLNTSMRRAFQTLSSDSGINEGVENISTEDLLKVASERASATRETYQDDVVGVDMSVKNPENNKSSGPLRLEKKVYLGDPCVTGTALAHSLWSSVIIPNVDTVIDATCGNGRDALALARLLFVDENLFRTQDKDESEVGFGPKPELLCIDIQRRACENTQRSLMNALNSDTFANYVRVLTSSHAPLPRPRDTRSIGLVAYNLGYLPGTDDKDAFATQIITTIFSLTDASLLLRTGGLLSVMTYPGTSPNEADAVKYFCEGLAMLTSRNSGGWKEYVDQISEKQGSGAIRELVRSSLERVVREGEAKQTWRVFEHKPLGRPLSPILVTAMRIK